MTREEIRSVIRGYRMELELHIVSGGPDPQRIVVLSNAIAVLNALAAQILSPEPPLEEKGGGEET